MMKESIKAIVGCLAIFLKVLISTNQSRNKSPIQQSEPSDMVFWTVGANPENETERTVDCLGSK